MNSTPACAIVAKTLHIPVAHVEARLRSDDRSMPEAIKRLVTDAISDGFFVTEPSGLETNAVKKANPRYAVVTLHRPSNADGDENLRRLTGVLNRVAQEVPILRAAHPRTRENLESAALVPRDSGGLQEETTALGVPCVTMRETTERPVTVDEGSKILAGTDPEKVLAGQGKAGRRPRLWERHAAERIVAVLARKPA